MPSESEGDADCVTPEAKIAHIAAAGGDHYLANDALRQIDAQLNPQVARG